MILTAQKKICETCVIGTLIFRGNLIAFQYRNRDSLRGLLKSILLI